MTRGGALSFLQTEYTELATEAQFTDSQSTTAYETAIDMSLRQLGYQEGDLPTVDVPQSQIIGYLCLLNYYAIKRFNRLFAMRFDVNIAGSLQANRSQVARQMQNLLEDAEKEAAALGFAVGKDAVAFGLGRMELDYLEPNWGEF